MTQKEITLANEITLAACKLFGWDFCEIDGVIYPGTAGEMAEILAID
jgi:hypothetical protein